MSMELEVPIFNRGTYLIPGHLLQGCCENVFSAALSQDFQDEQQFQFQKISAGWSLEASNGVILEATERFDSTSNSFSKNMWWFLHVAGNHKAAVDDKHVQSSRVPVHCGHLPNFDGYVHRVLGVRKYCKSLFIELHLRPQICSNSRKCGCILTKHRLPPRKFHSILPKTRLRPDLSLFQTEHHKVDGSWTATFPN